MNIKDELNARAKYKEGDKVHWHAVPYKVWVRFWRRSEDAFFYSLREIREPGTHPHMPKKVPESELEGVVDGTIRRQTCLPEAGADRYHRTCENTRPRDQGKPPDLPAMRTTLHASVLLLSKRLFPRTRACITHT